MPHEKILLVDDSRMVLKFHSLILRQAGYELEVAENGYLALETLMKSKFHLIVTDVNMPKMDGYALVAKIRGMDEYKSTPIIMVSTESETQDLTRGITAGANSYLFKPVDADSLLTQINMLLAKSRKMAV